MTSTKHAAYLDAFRTQVATPAKAAAGNRVAICARLAAGETVDYDNAVDEATGETTLVIPGWSQRAAGFMLVVKPVALSVGLAVAGLGAIKGGSITWAALRDKPSTGDSAVVGNIPPAPRPAIARVPAPEPASTALPPAPLPAPALRVAEPEPALGPALPRPAAEPPDVESAGGAVDRLREENALLQQAKARMDREDWDGVLTTLARHAERFEHGMLVPERVAWETIARCKLGRGNAVTQLRTFNQRFPGSVLTPMVRRACEGSTP